MWVCGCLHDARGELARDGARVAARLRVAPRDHLAGVRARGEGLVWMRARVRVGAPRARTLPALRRRRSARLCICICVYVCMCSTLPALVRAAKAECEAVTSTIESKPLETSFVSCACA